MATNAADEDYIDIELLSSSSSSSSFFCGAANPPTHSSSKEFEFQMSSSISSNQRDSPADELFYKGKLLPLQLPPRLQMVQKLLQASTIEEDGHTRFFSSCTAPSSNANTPLDQSCNISPSESCRASCELNPADYFFEWSSELRSFINNHPKKSWSKKLKMIKQISVTQKLKASRAYLKSFFSKSVCSNESCAKAAASSEQGKYIKVAKKLSPFGHIGNGPYPTLANVAKTIDKEVTEENMSTARPRRSFSGAIKRHSPSKCLSSSSSSSGASSLSSSFSINSNVLFDWQLLRRSSSDTSEIEGSIEAAIAHCKNSQKVFNSTNTVSEAGFCSLSTFKIVPSENEDKLSMPM